MARGEMETAALVYAEVYCQLTVAELFQAAVAPRCVTMTTTEISLWRMMWKVTMVVFKYHKVYRSPLTENTHITKTKRLQPC